MATTVSLTISPIPAQTPASPSVFDLEQLQAAMRAALGLNLVAPTSRVLLSQVQGVGGRDVHQFQVFTADARSWVEQVEFVGGDLARPSLARQDEGFEFAYDEWNAIVALRSAMLDAHAALGQPSLIQLALSTGSSSVVLSAQAAGAVHGQGEVVAGWHSPSAGHLDWVALYAVGAANNAFLAYQYVPDGQVDGELEFAAPGAAGTYEFRYLVANSYADVARSPSFAVA